MTDQEEGIFYNHGFLSGGERQYQAVIYGSRGRANKRHFVFRLQ